MLHGFFIPRCSYKMTNVATTVHALSALAPEPGAATLENEAKLSLRREQLEQTKRERVSLAAENHQQILKLLNVVRGSVTAANVSPSNFHRPQLPSVDTLQDPVAPGPVPAISATCPNLHILGLLPPPSPPQAINDVDAIVVRVCELNFVPDHADVSSTADLKREYEFLRNFYELGDVRAAIDRRIEAIEQATAPKPDAEPDLDPEPDLNPEPDPDPDPDPEFEPEPEPEPEPEQEFDPELELEPDHEFDPEPPMTFEPVYEPVIGSAAGGFDDDDDATDDW